MEVAKAKIRKHRASLSDSDWPCRAVGLIELLGSKKNRPQPDSQVAIAFGQSEFPIGFWGKAHGKQKRSPLAIQAVPIARETLFSGKNPGWHGLGLANAQFDVANSNLALTGVALIFPAPYLTLPRLTLDTQMSNGPAFKST